MLKKLSQEQQKLVLSEINKIAKKYPSLVSPSVDNYKSPPSDVLARFKKLVFIEDSEGFIEKQITEKEDDYEKLALEAFYELFPN